jgi:DMSO reductase anchor subunit
MLPADYYEISPQHPHWPLVAMLVLTQLSVGAFVTGVALDLLLPAAQWELLRPVHALTALVAGLVALAASTLHLGRPHLAFRAVLGFRHSWLSREIVAFGLFAVLACLYAGAVLGLDTRTGFAGQVVDALPLLVSLAGLAGVGCSVMIYAFTRREFWNPLATGVKFCLTTALLGVATVWLCILLLAASSASRDVVPLAASAGACAQVLIAIAGAKLLWEALVFRHLLGRRTTALKRSALLMTRELSNVTLARFALGLLGGVVMPAFLLSTLARGAPEVSHSFVITAVVLVAACTAGEFLERYLFFAAASAPRMPGTLR